MYIGSVNIQLIGIMIIKALLIFFIGKFIINKLIKWTEKFLEKQSIENIYKGFLTSIIKFVLMFLLIIAILKTFNVDTSSFVAILGAATLAIGFALQGNLSNFASGVMIVTFKPFKIGDYVETAGHSGVVEEIGVFMATLKTPDNKKILIPNSSITGGSIKNYSAYSKRRVDLTVGVSYDAEIDNVKTCIKEVIDLNELIYKDHDIFIRVSELADSCVNYSVRVWTSTENYWDVYFDLLENIKMALDKNNISIPYPHVTVEMKKN